MKNNRFENAFGPVPESFEKSVQQALRQTKEVEPVKRFTLRTTAFALAMLCCLLVVCFAATTDKPDRIIQAGAPEAETTVTSAPDAVRPSATPMPEIKPTPLPEARTTIDAYVLIPVQSTPTPRLTQEPERDMLQSTLTPRVTPAPEENSTKDYVLAVLREGAHEKIEQPYSTWLVDAQLSVGENVVFALERVVCMEDAFYLTGSFTSRTPENTILALSSNDFDRQYGFAGEFRTVREWLEYGMNICDVMLWITGDLCAGDGTPLLCVRKLKEKMELMLSMEMNEDGSGIRMIIRVNEAMAPELLKQSHLTLTVMEQRSFALNAWENWETSYVTQQFSLKPAQ